MLTVRSHDPDVRRKGRTLAVVILGIAASMVALWAMNLLRGQLEYNVSNGLFLALVLAMFLVNRLGYVAVAGLLTSALIVLGSAFFLSERDLAESLIVMCIPLFIMSFLVVPWGGIVVAALIICGIVVFDHASFHYLSLFSLATVSVVVYLLADSLDRAYTRDRHRALHDHLTDLPNRALFLDRLQQAVDHARRDRRLSAVLFLDLDDFKVVNDSLGHEAGDALLIVAARRLKESIRPGDTVARLGGDEFTVLLDGIAEVGDAIRAAERIAEEVRAPFDLGGRQVFLTTSVGIVLCDSPGDEPGALLRDADVAMYDAKNKGKARYEAFDSRMHARALERLEMENELRRAIEREELRVHYQPKVCLKTGGISGVEALVRWEHPERGLLGPGEFIPLAEETGLVVPLGQWVCREACRRARGWQERYPVAPCLVTSVNLSVRQFRDPDLVEKLAETLRESGLDPSRLQLEITESVVTDDVGYATAVLRDLKSLGVQLAIDDFGKGYSSLDTLKRFPLDELKIDRSFVDGIEDGVGDAAIVRLMVDLAHTMGMRAVGEGVETVGQLDRLREMGCDTAQGYHFCKPLTGEAATALFADPPCWLPNREPGAGLEERRYRDPLRRSGR